MTLAATSAKKKQLDLWGKISIDNEKLWANIPDDNRIDCLEWIAKLLRSAVRVDQPQSDARRALPIQNGGKNP